MLMRIRATLVTDCARPAETPGCSRAVNQNRLPTPGSLATPLPRPSVTSLRVIANPGPFPETARGRCIEPERPEKARQLVTCDSNARVPYLETDQQLCVCLGEHARPDCNVPSR